MGYFFTSTEVFWREFVPFFILYNGIAAVIEYQFLHKFMCFPAFKKSGCLALLFLSYFTAALCIQFHITGLSEKLFHFAILAGFAYSVSRLQKQDHFSTSLTAGMLIITVLALTEGLSAPIMSLLIRCGAMQNGFLFTVSILLFSLFSLLLLGATFCFICHSFCFGIANELRYLFVLFVPLTLLVVVSQLIFDVGYGDTMVINDNQVISIVNHYSILFTFTLAFVCFFIILFSFKKLSEQIIDERQKDLLAQQLAAQEIYTKEASHHYERTRSFRHDLNNHLLVLRALIDTQQGDKATAYLQHLEVAASCLTDHNQTGNIALDALFDYKLIVARQSGVQICLDVDMPQKTTISDFDLCVIFANALDNAITACSFMVGNNKWLDIKAKRKQDFLLIDIMNSYDRQKKSTQGSGVGLQNIKLICEKYGGTMRVETGEAVFILTALLPLQEQT